MIKAAEFSPYERVVARCIDYAQTVPELSKATISFLFEDGVATRAYSVAKGGQEATDIESTVAQNQNFMSQAMITAEVTIVNGEEVINRKLIIENDLLTDEPYQADKDGEGTCTVYEEPCIKYEEAERIPGSLAYDEQGKPPTQEPAGVRPLYIYTTPRVQDDTWLMRGPSPLLFNYKGNDKLVVSKNGKDISVYGLLSESKYVPDIEPPDDRVKPNGEAIWTYWLHDGVSKRKFVPGPRTIGINGEYLEPQTILNCLRIFITVENTGYNDLACEPMDITIDHELHQVLLRCDVKDGVTYLSAKAFGYHEKYLRESEAFDAYLDDFVVMGDKLCYMKDSVTPVIVAGKQLTEQILGGVTRTATWTYAHAIAMMYSFGGSIRQWCLAIRTVTDGNDSLWDIEGDFKKYPASWNRKDTSFRDGSPKLGYYEWKDVHTIVGSSDVKIATDDYYNNGKQDGIYVAHYKADDSKVSYRTRLYEYFLVQIKEGRIVAIDSFSNQYPEGSDLTAMMQNSSKYSVKRYVYNFADAGISVALQSHYEMPRESIAHFQPIGGKDEYSV